MRYLKGKKMLVRVDLNVPLNDYFNITDDTKIRAAVPTIKYLQSHGAKVMAIGLEIAWVFKPRSLRLFHIKDGDNWWWLAPQMWSSGDDDIFSFYYLFFIWIVIRIWFN
jgi:hypothetical protein